MMLFGLNIKSCADTTEGVNPKKRVKKEKNNTVVLVIREKGNINNRREYPFLSFLRRQESLCKKIHKIPAFAGMTKHSKTLP